MYRHVHVFVGCLPFCSGAQIGSLEFQLVQGRGFEPPGQWRSDVVHSESTCLVAPAMRNSGSGGCGKEFFVKTKSDWNVSGMSQKFRLMLGNTVVISSQYASCLLYFLNKIGSYHHGSAQPESLGMWHLVIWQVATWIIRDSKPWLHTVDGRNRRTSWGW